ncbi:MAG: leucine-rich repeat domain-containing protein [Eubacteriales bacterium]|nr:leucine-rich repeat domain-containing protein [Eubacteriales bacterium]
MGKADIEIIFSDQKGAEEARLLAGAMIFVFFQNDCSFLPLDNIYRKTGWIIYRKQDVQSEAITECKRLRTKYMWIYSHSMTDGSTDAPYYETAKELTGQIRQEGTRFVFSDCSGVWQIFDIERAYYMDFYSQLCFMMAAEFPEISFEGMRRMVDQNVWGKRRLTHAVYDKRTLTFEEMKGDPGFIFKTVDWTRTAVRFMKHIYCFPCISVKILTDDHDSVMQDKDINEWIRCVNDIKMDMVAAELSSLHMPYHDIMLHASSRELCEKYRDELVALLARKGWPAEMFSILRAEELRYPFMRIPASATMIDNRLFSHRQVKKWITLPENITIIGEEAFSHCTSLEEMSMSRGVTEIGSRAFEYCTALEKITLSQKLETVESEVFRCCEKLKGVVIPDSVTEIGSRAFCRCESLKSMIIPEKVRKIETKAFYHCRSLKSIVIPESVIEFGKDIFEECSPDLVIRGKRGSEAERYAAENGIKFEEYTAGIRQYASRLIKKAFGGQG